jgi:hypothetical protein
VSLAFRPPAGTESLPSHRDLSFRFAWTLPTADRPFPTNYKLRVEGLPSVWSFREEALAFDFMFAVYPFLWRPFETLEVDYTPKLLPNPQVPLGVRLVLAPKDAATNPLANRVFWIDAEGVPRRVQDTSKYRVSAVTEFEYEPLADGRLRLGTARTRPGGAPTAPVTEFAYRYESIDDAVLPVGVKVTLHGKEVREIAYDDLRTNVDVSTLLEDKEE